MSTTATRPLGAGILSAPAASAEELRALLDYAVLAPSSHNSQPWQFEIAGARLRLFADRSRWLRVADADQRELYLSLGCALENLLIAARYFGYTPRVRYLPAGEEAELVAEVELSTEPPLAEPGLARLFEAITRRHTNHRPYDGRTLAAAEIAALESVGGEEGMGIHLTVDPGVRREVDALVARADALQFADPAWRDELAGWLGQGAFGTGWLMSKMSALAVSYLDLGASTARKDGALLRSASALGVITVARPDRAAQLKAGQLFERLFLTATDRGVQLQPMNQLLQVPEVRRRFEALLPREWGIPQITFRLGYAEAEGHTPRRPVEEVLR